MADPCTQTTLTGPQRKALAFLGTVDWATPADIGMSLAPGLKAQGLGRLGGRMGTKLVQMGLAFPADLRRQGFPAYRISQRGREALNV